MAERRHRVRRPLTPEEKRRLLARRRYDKRYRKIEQAQRRGPQFLMVLLSLLALSLILYKMFGPELLLEDDIVVTDTFVGVTEDRSAEVRQDPAPFRSEIESFEKTLFGDQGAGSLNDLGENLALDARTLIERFANVENPRITSLSESLENLAGEASRPGFDLERLADARASWSQTRDETFLRAQWFGAAATSMDEDAGFQAVYRQAASSLFDLTETAHAEAEALSEVIGEGESIGGSWQEFEQSFKDQLREIEWSLPEDRPAAKTEPAVLAAIQKLELTFGRVRDLVAGTELSYPARLGPFDEARELAREAMDAFEELDGF